MASRKPAKCPRRRSSVTSSKCLTLFSVAYLCCSEHNIIQSLAAASPSSTTSTPPSGPFNADVIANFLRNRCGNNNESPAMWSYEGSLTDPMTGKVIAEVEGLELVKSLPKIEPSHQSPDIEEQSILDSLSVQKVLFPENDRTSKPQWDSATTVLSRRLFCYRRPSSTSTDSNAILDSNGRTTKFSPYKSLLTSLRLRPDGPLRYLSPLESMAIYDSAVTYIPRNKGQEMVVFSERGRCGYGTGNEQRLGGFVMGSAKSNSSGKGLSLSSIFDLEVQAQKGTLNSNSGPMLPPLKLPSSDSDEVTISPPRSRLFQFGKGDGNGSSSERKYGSVREMYRYSFDHRDSSATSSNTKKSNFFGQIKKQISMNKSEEESLQTMQQSTVRYTRYGEAPPWYAPGRSCTLELRGKRILLPHPTDMAAGGDGGIANPLAVSQNLPPLALWAASKCNFWSGGWPSVFSTGGRNAESSDLVRQYYQLPQKSEKELARHAVELFSSYRQLLLGEFGDDYPVAQRPRWLSCTENTLSKVQSCFSRLSKSFTVSEFPGKSL